MKGSGGTDGGVGMFLGGLALAVAAIYFFFDSIYVQTGTGFLSGLMRRGGSGRLLQTTSMGLLFVPFFVGVFSLFVDARRNWAWWLTYLGIAVLAIEILSRIRFEMSIKMTHLLGLIVMFAAGAGLMVRSYRAANLEMAAADARRENTGRSPDDDRHESSPGRRDKR